jgi:hypothetical protein
MPEQYDNNMRGVLFQNDKRGNDKAPDMTGRCEIEGHEYRLAAWMRHGKKGPYLSISVSEFQTREQPTFEDLVGTPQGEDK